VRATPAISWRSRASGPQPPQRGARAPVSANRAAASPSGSTPPPPEPQDRFSLAMLGQWALALPTGTSELAVQPRSFVLERSLVLFPGRPEYQPIHQQALRMTNLTVTCSSGETCEFRGSGTGTDALNYCKGTVTVANGSLMLEAVPDVAAREANVSGGRPAPQDRDLNTFCNFWTKTYERGRAIAIANNPGTPATGPSESGGGNNSCNVRCGTAQSACVLRCNGMRSCISECGAKSIECVGGC
jgi:hypothetical protein